MRQAAPVCRGALGAVALVLCACGGDASPPTETDLARVLELADVTAESSEVLPGDYERRRELLHGWSAPREGADGAFATNTGRKSGLNWRLAWARPLELVLSGRPLAAAGNEPTTVRVSWNGKPLGELDLVAGAGFEDHRLDVPVSVQRPGPNEVLLDYSSVPASQATSPQVAWRRIRVEGAGAGARPFTATDGTLHLPFGASVDYHVLLPEGGVLEIDDLGLYGPQGGWRNAEPAPRLVAAVHLSPTGSAAAAATLTEGRGQLQLPAHDSPLRIRIEALAGDRIPGAEAGFRLSALLSSPTVPWPHTGPLVANISEPSAERPDARLPHILIFLIDTLRADHLGCYGYARPTSPNIDRFAADAVRFDHPVAQSPWTRPATASILTGLYPHNHGARTRNQRLGEDIPYLPEVLSSLGYRTLGATTNGNAGPRFGFRRGFNHFKHFEERTSRPGIHIPVRIAVDETLTWLERIGPEDSFFVFLHVTDPHAPYLPPEPQRRQFAPDAPAGAGIPGARTPAGPIHTTEDLKDLYDGEIAFVDEHFGHLLATLDDRGFLDDTLVVLVSDHGEEFMDHGSHGHGRTLYQEQLRVPLIIRLPDRLRPSEDISVVEAQVQQIDIVPTILDAIGHPGSVKADGRSLLPLMRGESPSGRATLALSELRLGAAAADAVFLEHGNLRRKAVEHGTRRQLFHPTEDPAELEDLSRQSLWAEYLSVIGRIKRRAAGPLTAGIDPAMPAAQREALKALGYID